MDGAGRCPVYLERWTFFNLFGVAVYLHHFLGDDWAIDPHDHPRRFTSIGLKGWYYEDVYGVQKWAGQDGQLVTVHKGTTKYTAPWFRSFPATHIHRIRASECGNCWTLVIVGPKRRAWGFIRDGVWTPFREYVFSGKARKSC